MKENQRGRVTWTEEELDIVREAVDMGITVTTLFKSGMLPNSSHSSICNQFAAFRVADEK